MYVFEPTRDSPPGGANVHAHPIYYFFGVPLTIPNNGAIVQPFLHGRYRILPLCFIAPLCFSLKDRIQISPLPWRDLDPRLIPDFLDPPDPPPQMSSRSNQPFCHNTIQLGLADNADTELSYKRGRLCYYKATRPNNITDTYTRRRFMYLTISPPAHELH